VSGRLFQSIANYFHRLWNRGLLLFFEDTTKVVVNINNFLDSSSWSMKLKLFTLAHL
jgi:hypothetical protein